jgi:hypothetical protein
MAKVYRHTTPEMLARVVAAVADRLAIALDVAQVCPSEAHEGQGNRKEGAR